MKFHELIGNKNVGSLMKWINDMVAMQICTTTSLYYKIIKKDLPSIPTSCQATTTIPPIATSLTTAIKIFQKKNKILLEKIVGNNLALIRSIKEYTNFLKNMSKFYYFPRQLLVSLLLYLFQCH